MWWLSRICEEFQCLPSEALREWRRAPVGLLEEIIEARAFAAAKQIVDAADTDAKVQALPDSPMVRLAREIEMEIAEAAWRAAHTDHG